MFAALARAADLRLSDFNVQALANTAWAFATASQSDALLFAMLAREAEWRIDDFNAQELSNTAWALSQLANLTDSWGSLKHISCTGQSSSLICVQQLGALLMECEQRGLPDYEMNLSRGLEPCD